MKHQDRFMDAIRDSRTENQSLDGASGIFVLRFGNNVPRPDGTDKASAPQSSHMFMLSDKLHAVKPAEAQETRFHTILRV